MDMQKEGKNDEKVKEIMEKDRREVGEVVDQRVDRRYTERYEEMVMDMQICRKQKSPLLWDKRKDEEKKTCYSVHKNCRYRTHCNNSR